MFAQQTSYRPEIARVAEETVLNLKQLESRIEVLRNDLAALCNVLGHPEAARIAVTPPAWLGITPHGAAGNLGAGSPGTFGSTPFQGSFQGSMPWGVQSPYGATPPTPGIPSVTQGFSPWTQQGVPYGAFGPYTPYGAPGFGSPPFGQGVTPPYPIR